MIQAYIKPNRQQYTRQKDLPAFKISVNSREIQDKEPNNRFVGYNRSTGNIHQVRKHVRNLDVYTNAIYRVTTTNGVVQGCRINKGATLDVALCGKASQVTVYGTLVVGARGHAADIVLKGHGRLIVMSGGSAKRVYRENKDCIIQQAPNSYVSEARYNRVSDFPINI